MKHKIILSFIIVFAFGLRIYKLVDAPPGLNRDEAAIGYTAYSLLKTGKDEYGTLWPISLKSFGDWKLPGYIYSTIPAVSIFGLTEFAVRLPSVIFGTCIVLLIYLLAKELFKKSSVALISASIAAISPWALFFSRVASEANMAAFFTCLGIYLCLKVQSVRWFLPIGTVILASTMLTYHGSHVFTPFLFIALAIFLGKPFWKSLGWLSIGLFAILAGVVYSQTLLSADKTKISGLFVLNDQSLVYTNVIQNRLIFDNNKIGKLFNNKAVFFVEQIAKNYIRSFSPEFLFIKGGENRQHNIPDFGNLYLIEAPLLLLGLYYLFSNKEKSSWLILIWILLSPIGAAFTKDAPHSARSFIMVPALVLVMAYGITELMQPKKSITTRNFILGTFIIGYILNVGLFMSRYFVLFPYKEYEAWGKAYKEMVVKITQYKNLYQEVIVGRPEYSPYIYYLFYTQSNPSLVQNTLIRYAPTSEGFEHVKNFDGITYQKIAWSDELITPNRLYIDWADNVPSGATHSAIFITSTELTHLKDNHVDTKGLTLGTIVTSQLIDTVRLPDASPLLYFIETRIGTPSGQHL